MVKRVILAITGASGTRYGRRLLQVLSGEGVRVDLILSQAARAVLLAEEGLTVKDPLDPLALVADLGGAGPLLGPGPVTVHPPEDLAADIASGSTLTDGMIILPCSMATLGAIASGAGHHLVHRAADVTLKEGRPLVIAPRETPLHAVHLANLLRLAQAGARILPCMPAFTARPRTLDDLVDSLVMRAADQLGLHVDLVPRWGGSPPT